MIKCEHIKWLVLSAAVCES